MSSPFIGEIRMFGGNFAPVGWAFCDGALMAIDQNNALFNLIGTTYGGDGQTTFALPNLQSRVPVHVGPSPFHSEDSRHARPARRAVSAVASRRRSWCFRTIP